MTLDPALELTLRLALAGLLAVSAWPKLRYPEAFRAALEGYR